MFYYTKPFEDAFLTVKNMQPGEKAMYCEGYEDHHPHGQSTTYIAAKDGHVYLHEKGLYQKGAREGEWEHYDQYGGREYLSEKGSYIDDKKEGAWQSFYPDGNIKQQSSYVGGQKDGLSTGFQENGDVWSTTTYRGGKKNGPAEAHFYRNRGNPVGVRTQAFYQNDVLHGAFKEFRVPGILEEAGTYIHGQKEGEWVKFLDDGVTVESKETYQADKKTGPFRRYFENGNLATKGQFDDGCYRGVWENYNEDGTLYSVFASGNNSDKKTKDMNRELWWLKLGDNAKELFNEEKKNRTAEQRAADQMNKIYEKYPQYKPVL